MLSIYVDIPTLFRDNASTRTCSTPFAGCRAVEHAYQRELVQVGVELHAQHLGLGDDDEVVGERVEGQAGLGVLLGRLRGLRGGVDGGRVPERGQRGHPRDVHLEGHAVLGQGQGHGPELQRADLLCGTACHAVREATRGLDQRARDDRQRRAVDRRHVHDAVRRLTRTQDKTYPHRSNTQAT